MVRILNWVVCFFCISVTISGQTESQDTTATVYAEEDLYEDDPYFWSHTKEIGLNFTPLLSKFIPFNLGKTDAGLIGLKYKKYYSERAFLVNFGSNITSRASNDGSIFFYLGFGLERRRPISKDKKFAYTSGYEIFFSADGADASSTAAFAKSYGFEYHFNKRLFLSTEGALQIGLSDPEPFFIRFAIPVAIFLNVRLY
jgi:hypothetical protein